MNSNYRFLNPYNFVRYLSEGKKDDLPEIKLLGRCAPPPHDRFTGLTGKIECELEAITPIFISDSEFIENKENEHKSYRFFRLENDKGEEEFAIPSTSLRGMLRSVFEAATNSCFSIFEGEKRLSYRDIKKSRYMKPAIVLSLPDEKSMGKMEICEMARVPFGLLKKEDWSCGDKAYAEIKGSIVKKIKKNYFNFSQEGWLKKTGKNIDKKRNEYFFYRKNKEIVEFNKDRMDDYNNMLQEQIAEGFSTEYQSDKLDKGNLVYVEVNNKKVKNISLVKVPRLFYYKSIKDSLPEYLYLCYNYSNLCPGCRLFGWVNPEPEDDPDKKVSYAGRVRVSNAKITENKGTLNSFPLAILSTPKPTTTYFYLLKNGKPDIRVTYDTEGAHLRGRKFYKHQSKAENKEYRRAGYIRDQQNRTLRDALKPGARFIFTIEFENLAPLELGSLLWTIELENNMFHKLGMGKPLGFGSIKINVKDVKILDIMERYSSILNNGWKSILSKKEELINLFKEKMETKYYKTFENLDNIKDLKSILSPASLPIHYPRTEEEPSEEGRNFDWFMNNKKNRIPLPLAPDDKTGFQLNYSQKKWNKRKY